MSDTKFFYSSYRDTYLLKVRGQEKIGLHVGVSSTEKNKYHALLGCTKIFISEVIQ